MNKIFALDLDLLDDTNIYNVVYPLYKKKNELDIFFKKLLNGNHQNLWEDLETNSKLMLHNYLHYSMCLHIQTGFRVILAKKYLIEIDKARDKKIDKLLC